MPVMSAFGRWFVTSFSAHDALPVLAAIPENNEAARVVKASGGGVVVDARDQKAVLDAADHLLRDSRARAAAGRRAADYARDAFDANHKANEFEAVLNAIVLRSHSPSPAKADTAAMSSDNAPAE